MLKNLLLLTHLLLLGACSTGMVASDVDLNLSDVSIDQGDEVQVGAEFSHLLREEILYQFSKSPYSTNQNKTAFLNFEIQKLAHPGNQADNRSRKSSLLAGVGSLVDQQTGSKTGDFRLSVSHRDQRYKVSGIAGRNIDQSVLIEMMARAILKKVYGSSRADKMAEYPGRYVRQPYRQRSTVQLTRNHRVNNRDDGEIGGLRLSLANGVLPADFIGPPMEAVEENKAPEVIEAPKLLVH